MAEYLVVYHGSPEQLTEHDKQLVKMESWMAWMGGIGSAVKDAGHPTTRAWTVSKDGTEESAGANPVTGYTVLTADSMQAALEMVTGCPHIEAGGTIELCELSSAGHASSA